MGLRRFLGAVPRLVGRTWNDITKELQDYLERLRDSVTNGIPGGVTSQIPTTIQADVAAARGDESAGWSPGNHQHAVDVGTAVDLGEASAEGIGSELARADHIHKLAVRVSLNGATVGTRKRLNLVDGASITWTVTDDASNDEVDVSAVVDLTGITHALLSATHSDTVASAVTKGSLVVGNSTPAWEEFPVGSDGDVLTADSAEPFGVKWEAPSGGGGGGFWDRDAGNGWIWPTTVSDQVLVGADTAVVVTSNLEVEHTVLVHSHFDALSTPPTITSYRSRGTLALPTSVQTNDQLFNLRILGYDDLAPGYSDQADIIVRAIDDWDGASGRGTSIAIHSTKSGDFTSSEVFKIVGAITSIGDGVTDAYLTAAGAPGHLIVREGITIATPNDNNLYNDGLVLLRYRADSTAPGAAGFGTGIVWRMEGFTNNSAVEALRLVGGWELAQSNDTTDRDSFMAIHTMLDDTLAEKLRVTSVGLVVAASDNAQDIGSGSVRWKDGYFARGLFGLGGSSSGIGQINTDADSDVTHLASESCVTGATARTHWLVQRSRGSHGSRTDVAAADVIWDLDCQAYDAGAYATCARIQVDVEANTNVPGGRLLFYTKQDSGHGSALALRLAVTHTGNVVVGNQAAALGTTAVTGFLHIPTCAGTPTGVPNTYTGAVPLVYDTTNHILYVYSGGAWRAH